MKIADDGKIYVCDRGNDRIQVFDEQRSRRWASPAAIPTAWPASAAIVAEQAISGNTETMPAMPGTSVSLNFSKDKAQSCLYVGDNSNMTIYILNRANLQELGRLGRAGPQCRAIPLAAPGQPGQPWQHLYGRSRYRKAHPEIPALWRGRAAAAQASATVGGVVVH